MDKLIETSRERFWFPEAWARDEWVRSESAKLPPGSRVLDAGAGASKYRPLFSHCQYETQDFCEYKGELVKYLKPIDYVCEITKIPLPDGSLDAIICTEVLEHLTDPMAALKEFSRLLKPGGRLLLTAPHGTLLHMEPYHYYSGFTHYWYRYWLPRLGFELDALVPQGGPGRSAVSFMHAFYSSWRRWETSLRGFKRVLSLTGRMAVKIPVHYILAWTLPKFDPYLDRNEVCLGFMVSANRTGTGSTANLAK